jgi:hypothetical protein
MLSYFGGLQVKEINFVGTLEHLVAELKELVKENGKPRTKKEEQRVSEERELKVIYPYLCKLSMHTNLFRLNDGVFTMLRGYLLEPRGRVIIAGKVEQFI